MAKAAKVSPFNVIRQDCVVGMLSPEYVVPGAANLVIADPPYNFGIDYSDYNDKLPAAEYWEFTKDWLRAAYAALHPRGSMWLFFPDEWISEVDLFCRKELELQRRNWLIWTFTFGQAAQKSFTRSKVHLLYYAKDKKNFTFNADAIRVPSARQLKYNDKRANSTGKLPDDTWALLKQDLELTLNPEGDVMLESRVCGTYKARQKHAPNQIPVPLLSRIIKATSNPGDLILDPFNGSGSTGEAALRLGRRYLGFDVSDICVKFTGQRLNDTLAELSGRGPGQQKSLFTSA